ncbi:MAG: replicative DNA helicase, partial [Ferruginibacter sp.]
KLRALLHIQKFVEDPEGGENGGGFTGGNFRPIKPDEQGGGDAKLFIQKGSKMNDSNFNADVPF